MPIAPACPDRSRLEQLAAGQLEPRERDGLLEHLEACPDCVQRIETLAEKDTLIELIRSARTLGGSPASPTVDRIVDQLRALRPDAAVPPETLRFSCPDTGKRFRIKAELAGKKFKCPYCQAIHAVPGNPAALPSVSTDAPTLPPSFAASEQPPSATRTEGGTNATPAAEVDQGLLEFLAPAQMPDELGRLGHYRVLRVLGAGGMGVVFQAEDPRLQRLVALKAMLPGLAASASAKQRFLREAQAAAALKHDHIVTIHHVDEDRGAPYLAMEFLEGESLDDRLKREGRLPVAEVLRIGREMAEGLAAAHARGLIHRDIKPANVWLEGKRARVKILDFGLARAAVDAAHLTQSGAIVGTPAYMAPEQAQGKNLDARCDLFSLGCILYRLATGTAPFRGTDMISTLMSVATEHPAAPVTLNFELPTELSDFILELLAKEPADRPASAETVALALEQMAHGPPPAPVVPSRAPRRRRPIRGWAVAALVLALLVPLAGWLSGILLRVESKDGTLTIATDDPTVEVKVTGEGGATVTYGKDRRQIALKPGKYGIELANPKDGVTLSANQITIDSGGDKKVSVVWEPKKEAVAKIANPLPGHFTNSLGMEFALVPKGKAWLGGGDGKLGDREVTIPHDFYLGVYEVTQEEWEKVTGLDPSHFSRKGPGRDAVKGLSDQELKRLPVDQVSWDDAQSFLKRLNASAQVAGWVYRLPNESEWEYACRGGSRADRFDSAYDFYLEKPSNLLRPTQANFDNVLKRTCKVGSYRPNPLGLHDMHGNLWEWCDDLVKTPDGSEHRVRRGGGWVYHAGDCRASNRTSDPPSRRTLEGGLRLARVPMTAPTPAEDPDRRAAEYVLSIGGTVRVNGDERDLRAAADLPGTPFQLTSVELSGNQKVSDAGLAVFKECRALRQLSLGATKTTDVGLAHFANNQRLEALYLFGTDVSEEGLAHFKDCKHLQQLELTRTKVADLMLLQALKLSKLLCGKTRVADLAPLRNMPLTELRIPETLVSDLTPLKDMQTLRQLHCHDTLITDLSPLKDVPLTNLYCAHAPASDAGLKSLPEMASLRVLSMGGPKMTDAGLESLKRFPDLQEIVLIDGKWTGTGFVHFKGMKELRCLIMRGPELTDEGLAPLGELPGLHLLELRLARVTDAGLVHLARLKNLERLLLDQLPVTEKGVANLKAALPGCRIEVLGLPAAEPVAKTPSVVPPPAAALEALRREQIPLEALKMAGDGDADKAPAELVAVLGEALPIHRERVYAVAFSPDSRTLATASHDKTIHLWDAVAARPRRVLRGHTGPVLGVAFSKDGQTLLSASHDGTLKLWPLQGEAEPLSVATKLDAIGALVVSADGKTVAAGNHDGRVQIWKWGQWDKPLSFTIGKGNVHALALNPDGTMLASDEGERKEAQIHLIQTADGKRLRSWAADPGDGVHVRALAFQRDGQRLVSAAHHLKLWEVATGKQVSQHFNSIPFNVLALHPDGKSLYACINGFLGHHYELPSLERITPGGKKGFWAPSEIGTTAYSPDGQTLVFGTHNGGIHLWNTATWEKRLPKHSHTHTLTSLAVGSDGQTLLSGGDDNVLRRWDLARPGESLIVQTFDWVFHNVAFHPDRKSYATNSSFIWYDNGQRGIVSDLATGKKRFQLDPVPAVNGLAYSPDGSLLAGSTDDLACVCLWDASNGKRLHVFPPLAGPVSESHSGNAAFSADGKRLAAATLRSKHAKVWDVAGGEQVFAATAEPGMTRVALSFDGRFLAAGHWDGVISVWDTSAKEPQRRTLTGHHNHISELRFTPDGQSLISAGQDGTIRFWDHTKARPLQKLVPLGPTGRPLMFDLDPSGRYLFAAGSSPLIYVLRLPARVSEGTTGKR